MFEHCKFIARQLMTISVNSAFANHPAKVKPIGPSVTHILAKVTANILAESKSRKCTGSGGLLAKLR